MRDLFAAAEGRADRDGEPAPGAEHLLLAAVGLDDGVARTVFGDVGLFESGLAGAVERARAEVGAGGRPAGEQTIRHAGVFVMTAPAQHAFQAAGRYSRADGVTLNSGHVLAGITTLERGTVVTALRLLGVDRSALHGAARARARAR